MDVLVPIDGSDCSLRALEFAADFAQAFDARLHVVHFSDAETDATDSILETADDLLSAAGVENDSRVELDENLEFRPGERVGERILDLVAEHGYDHVIMGHHGSGTVERAILGSAAEHVLRAEKVRTTIIP